jgi:hypothetical protein
LEVAAKDQEKRRPRLGDSFGSSGVAAGGEAWVSDFGPAGTCVCAEAAVAEIAVAASIELATSSMSRRLIVA